MYPRWKLAFRVSRSVSTLLHLDAGLQLGDARRVLAIEEGPRTVVQVGHFQVREAPAELLLVKRSERRYDRRVGRAMLGRRGDRDDALDREEES